MLDLNLDLDFCEFSISENILFCEVEDKDELLTLIFNYTDNIVSFLVSANLKQARIRYPGLFDDYIISSEMSKILPGKKASNLEEIMSDLILSPEINSLFINCRITPQLLPVIEEILNNPEKNIGVTRIRDNSQVIVSSKHVLEMGTTGKIATSIRTTDYWQTESLLELQRKYRQESGIFEHEIITSNYVYKWLPEAPWIRMSVRYRLVDDGFGEIYRVGETLGKEQIDAPALIC